MVAFKLLGILCLFGCCVAQTRAQGLQQKLQPDITTDQVKGLICFDFELIEGLELRCNFQHGPENVNCTGSYKLNAEIFKPGRHVVDVKAFEKGTANQIGQVTVFFNIEKRLTLNLKVKVTATKFSSDVCFQTGREATFTCRLDNSAWAPCTSCKRYEELCPGEYTVTVMATSARNTSSNVEEMETFNIKNKGIDANMSAVSEGNDMTVCFDAERAAKFECRLNGGPWETCSSCKDYKDLCPGYYLAEVRVASTHCPQLVKTLSRLVKVGPSLDITAASLNVECNSGEYLLSTNIPAQWRCKIGDNAWRNCISGRKVASLPVGNHLVLMEARSRCNQSEKVQEATTISVPSNVKISNLAVNVASQSRRDSLRSTFNGCPVTSHYCQIDQRSKLLCTSPYAIPGALRPGTHVLRVTSEFDGTVYASKAINFFKELILKVNGNVSVSGSTLRACFGTTTYSATFECKIGSENWEKCSSCITRRELCPGRKVFWVRATASQNKSVMVTKQMPFRITDRNIIVNVSSQVSGKNARVCFVSSRSSTFTCARDGESPSICESCVTYKNLCAGDHTVQVAAQSDLCRGVAGSRTHQFQIQSNFRITTAQMNISCNSGRYILEASEPASFRCHINGRWRRCRNGGRVNGLAAGNFTIQVEATLLCNPSIKIRRSFSISVPANVDLGDIKVETSRTEVTATFSTCSVADYYCQIDSLTREKCTSPFVRSIRDLTPGRHMLSVQAERTYGASSTRQLAETVSGFEVDLTVSGSLSMEGDTVTYCFPASHNSSFRCKVDNSEWESCTSCHVYKGLCPGNHVIQLEVTSVENPSEQLTVRRDFTLSSYSLAISTSSNVSSEGADVCFSVDRSASLECRLDGGEWTSCTSCKGYGELCHGGHVVEVRGVSDECRNVSGSAREEFQIQSNFRITKVELKVECDIGMLILETSHPSLTQCRVGSTNWMECENGTVLNGLVAGINPIEIESKLECAPEVTVQRRLSIVAPNHINLIPKVEMDVGGQRNVVFETCSLTEYFCRLDNQEEERCQSPIILPSNLKPGNHTVEVVAKLHGTILASNVVSFEIEKPPICSLTNGLHLVSFTDESMDFSTTCHVELLSLRDVLTIEVLTELCHNGSLACIAEVKFMAHRLDTTVIMSSGSNGGIVTFEDSVPSPDALTVNKMGRLNTLILYNFEGITLSLEWNGKNNLRVSVQPQVLPDVAGVCQFNSTVDRMEDYLSGECAVTDISTCSSSEVLAQCSVFTPHGPYTACHSKVDPGPYFQRCMYDTCHCSEGALDSCSCTQQLEYAKACAIYGVELDLSQQSSCVPLCPQGREFQLCHPTCDLACTSQPCDSCTHGCFCSEGTIEIDSQCFERVEDCFADQKTANVLGSVEIHGCEAKLQLNSTEIVSYLCRLDNEAETFECMDGYIMVDLAPGIHTLEVSATLVQNPAIFTNTSLTWLTPDTCGGPSVSLSAIVSTKACGAVVNISVSGAEEEDLVVCLCYLDGSEKGALCSEGIAYKGLSEGNHTLRVVATVNSSVISENQVSWLNEGSCKELGFIATVRLNGNTMRLRIYLATPGVTFRCRLDNGEHGKWQECYNDFLFDNLETGSYVLHMESLSFDYKMTRRRLGPFYILPSRFKGSGSAIVTGNKVTLILKASDPEATFICRMDSLPWQPCQNGFVYEDLPPGLHKFTVKAVNSEGDRSNSFIIGPVQVGRVTTTGSCRLAAYIVASQGKVTLRIQSQPVNQLYRCHLDDHPWQKCYDGMQTVNVTSGNHVMHVTMETNYRCSSLSNLIIPFRMTPIIISSS